MKLSGGLLVLLFALSAPAQAAEVTLTRLDCGNEPAPVNVASFSDTYAYADDIGKLPAFPAAAK